MNEQINLRVSTSSLRKLLEDNADVQLRLENMACEKIAEEIIRKADKLITEKSLRDRVTRIADGIFSNFRTKWNFPNEAKELIRQFVHDYLQQERERIAMDFRQDLRTSTAAVVAEAKRELEAQMQKHQSDFIDWAKKEVRRQAHDEFVSILTSVKREI